MMRPTLRSIEPRRALNPAIPVDSAKTPNSRGAKTMRVVCISDTHELHRELKVPGGDLLIHAGDFTSFGKGTKEILDFNDWLGDLPHRYKVLTCGNHEYAMEADP